MFFIRGILAKGANTRPATMADARPEAEPKAPESLSPRPSTASSTADAAGAAPPAAMAVSAAARGTAVKSEFLQHTQKKYVRACRHDWERYGCRPGT